MYINIKYKTEYTLLLSKSNNKEDIIIPIDNKLINNKFNILIIKKG